MKMCPHCGWQYDPDDHADLRLGVSAHELVPEHCYVVCSPIEMSAAALEAGAIEEEIRCPGMHQHPRNPESDRRHLWKDLPQEGP